MLARLLQNVIVLLTTTLPAPSWSEMYSDWTLVLRITGRTDGKYYFDFSVAPESISDYKIKGELLRSAWVKMKSPAPKKDCIEFFDDGRCKRRGVISSEIIFSTFDCKNKKWGQGAYIVITENGEEIWTDMGTWDMSRPENRKIEFLRYIGHPMFKVGDSIAGLVDQLLDEPSISSEKREITGTLARLVAENTNASVRDIEGVRSIILPGADAGALSSTAFFEFVCSGSIRY